jgi:hypothetical protein
MFKERVLKEDP